jgi:hypothetical protein
MSLVVAEPTRGGDPENTGRFSIAGQSAPEIGALRPMSNIAITDADLDWWEKIADDTNTPVALLAQLALSERESVVANVAGNSSAPADVLTSLVQHESDTVRESLSYNTATPGAVLDHLTRNEYDLSSHLGVAANPSAWPETLCALYAVETAGYSIAGNPAAPADLLEHILVNGDEFERRCAIGNQNITAEQVDRASHDPEASVRLKIAGLWSTPTEIIDRLAKDEDSSIRESAAYHRHITEAVLHRLQMDPIKSVADAAYGVWVRRSRY